MKVITATTKAESPKEEAILFVGQLKKAAGAVPLEPLMLPIGCFRQPPLVQLQRVLELRPCLPHRLWA